eukprot:6213737-Pleurochrysis_carterae.AAC.4
MPPNVHGSRSKLAALIAILASRAGTAHGLARSDSRRTDPSSSPQHVCAVVHLTGWRVLPL